MNRFNDDFDGYNNRKHRESLSKKSKYEEEEDLDELDIVADDISEKFMGSYGIHNITPSKAKNAVVVYVDELWSQYFKYTNIDAKEANLIYTSALKYFKGESQNSYPVLPLIIEVDFMLKGVISMSREEFRTLSSNDLERLQLIMTARADALGLAYQQIAPPKAPEQDGFDSELMNSLPPHLKAAMKYA